MAAQRQAIIVGGGIGGLAAAIGLRRAGCDVAVYERAPELDEVGAGLTLWANAIRALDKLGLADPHQIDVRPPADQPTHYRTSEVFVRQQLHAAPSIAA